MSDPAAVPIGSPERIEEPDGSAFVQSLARGLAVVRAFDAEHPRRPLADIARATGLTRATARRFLLTLETLGYVRAIDGAFELTPRVLELGVSYLSALRLPEIAQPHLERLSRTVGESTSASVLDGDEIVYVARVPVRRIMSVGITIGTRFPAFATSMGRVLLAALPPDARDAALAGALPALTPRTVTDPTALRAELDRVAADGWSLVEGELESGLRALAAPVTRRGRTVAAVNLSTGDADARVGALLPELRATASAISAELDLLPDGATL